MAVFPLESHVFAVCFTIGSTSISYFCVDRKVTHSKVLTKRNASRRKFAKPELAYGLAMGGQTDSHVGSQVHASRKSRRFHAYAVYSWLAILKLLTSCVGWPNGEKVASICVRIWSRPKLTQVHTIKSTQVGGQTKRKLKTCVDLHWVRLVGRDEVVWFPWHTLNWPNSTHTKGHVYVVFPHRTSSFSSWNEDSIVCRGNAVMKRNFTWRARSRWAGTSGHSDFCFVRTLLTCQAQLSTKHCLY